MQLFELQAELVIFFPEHISFLWEKMIDRQNMMVQTWIPGRHFLKFGQDEPATSRKTTYSFVASDSI